MIGAGPFSFANDKPAFQPSIDKTLVTSSVKLKEASSPYLMPNMVTVEPKPK